MRCCMEGGLAGVGAAGLDTPSVGGVNPRARGKVTCRATPSLFQSLCEGAADT